MFYKENDIMLQAAEANKDYKETYAHWGRGTIP